mmetsp:Transcript_16445/g.39129  ORF Transcript_16445/g.39129 Transcript_16445/m.39129 type:complete len:100 (+) Transcript_16445:194-493(+)
MDRLLRLNDRRAPMICIVELGIWQGIRKFFGRCKLQQFADDDIDPMDLFIQQPQFRCGQFSLISQYAAKDIQVSLHDRDGIVDLVGDACGDLADGGQLL